MKRLLICCALLVVAGCGSQATDTADLVPVTQQTARDYGVCNNRVASIKTELGEPDESIFYDERPYYALEMLYKKHGRTYWLIWEDGSPACDVRSFF